MSKIELLRSLEHVKNHQEILIGVYSTEQQQVIYQDIACLHYGYDTVVIRSTDYAAV